MSQSRIDIVNRDGKEIIVYNFRVSDNQPSEIENSKPYTVCGAWIKEKERPCWQPAGYRTSHKGWGRCFMHGGSTQSPISQRNQKKTLIAGEVNYPGLREEVERLHAQKDVFDLRDEIFTCIAIAEEIMKKGETLDDLIRASTVLDRATKIAQRLHEIEEGKRLTIHVANLNVLMESVVDIIHRYVPDDYTRNLIARDIFNLKIGSGFPRPEPKQIRGEVVEI